MSVSGGSGVSMTLVQPRVYRGPTTPTVGSIGDIWISTASAPAIYLCTSTTPLWSLQGNIASVKTFGAVGNGVTNDTTAIQNAAASGLSVYFPAGTYIVRDGINCATKGQIFYGDGRARSIIKADSSFNMSALGVFYASCGEQGPQFKDLKITFEQADTAVRASITTYPPALYMRSTPRFSVRDCAITEAYTGIDASGGNSGGLYIETLELSAYSKGVWIDGALDSCKINNLHFWPFDLTANQTTVFNDGTTIGMYLGRCDDLHLSNSLFINKGVQLKITNDGTGTTFGNVVNCDFDNYAGIRFTAGDVSFSNCYLSNSDTATQALVQTGGYTKFNNCTFQTSATTTSPFIDLQGSNSGGSTAFVAQFSNCLFVQSGDMNMIKAHVSAGTFAVSVMGCTFFGPVSTSPTKAVIDIGTARLTAIGNRINDKGTGTGNWVALSPDEYHIVANNTLLGWGISIPSGTVGYYNGNSTVYGGDFSSTGIGYGTIVTKRFTGTLDGAGALTVAHGLTAAQQKVIMVQAFYKGGSGEMKAMALNYIDGTNLTATGGTASAAYRAVIVYTNTQQGW